MGTTHPLHGPGQPVNDEREKPHADLVIAGFCALRQQRLGVIRVFDIGVPVVPAGMAGKARGTARETEAIGIGLQRQGMPAYGAGTA